MARPAHLLTALLAPIAFITTAGYLISTNNWAVWGIEALPLATPATVSFGDVANITTTADCLANQLPIENCDPYGRPFQPYVELPARILNSLGLGTSNTQMLGIALAAVLLLTITALSVLLAHTWTKSTPQLFAAQALLALITIAPASMLAVERGQIEQLTLALVVAAFIALSARNTAIRFTGSLASLLATVTKYLSIGMFLPFINRSLLTKANRAALIGIVLSALFLLWSLPNVLLAAETSGASEPQTTKSGFSVTTMLATMLTRPDNSYSPSPKVTENWTTIRLISYALFVILLLAWLAILRHNKASSSNYLPTTSRAWILTLGSGGVLLFPYLLGNSHDYRLIFLIPLITGAVLLSQEHRFVGFTLTITATISALTSASMIPTPAGWKLPQDLLIAGDLALMVLLSGIAALWLHTALSKPKATTS